MSTMRLEQLLAFIRLCTEPHGRPIENMDLFLEELRSRAEYAAVEMKNNKTNLLCFEDYQSEALKTKAYPVDPPHLYVAAEISNEAGELLGKIKKSWRNGKPLDRTDVFLEMGDVLWPMACLANELGVTLDLIARMNIEKLRDRKKRGTLLSTGDHR